MGEAARFLLQRVFLAGREGGRLDLVRLEAEVVGALEGVAAAALELGHLPAQVGGGGVRGADVGHQRGVAGVRVEDGALLVAAQQRLVLVLAVQIHQQPPQLAQQGGGGGGAVHPGAAAPLGGHLALEHEHAVIDLDSPLVQQPGHLVAPVHLEHALDGRALLARAHHVARRALAQQQRQRADDDRLPRPRLAGQDVQSRAELDGESIDQREVPDAQLGEHLQDRSGQRGDKRKGRIAAKAGTAKVRKMTGYSEPAARLENRPKSR